MGTRPYKTYKLWPRTRTPPRRRGPRLYVPPPFHPSLLALHECLSERLNFQHMATLAAIYLAEALEQVVIGSRQLEVQNPGHPQYARCVT